MDLNEIRITLKSMETILREVAGMLRGYVENHFTPESRPLVVPKADWLDTAVWQSRTTTSLFCISAYYRMAAEMIGLALTTLNKSDWTGTAVLSGEKDANSVMLLNIASIFLHDAEKFMGLAGIELSCKEDCWRRLHKAMHTTIV